MRCGNPVIRSVVVVVAGVLGVGGVGGEVAVGQPMPAFSNVGYGDGHPRQVLDVYLPPGPAVARPVVVWVHGGGWSAGDKSSAAGRAVGLLQRGFVVVGINYRYSQQATFPAQIHDCKSALRHLRANAASYRIDPARIGVWGSSAGGHLVALLGTSGDVAGAEGVVGPHGGQSSRVQAVADYFGPAEFLGVEGGQTGCSSAASQLLGRCLAEIQANVDDPAWAAWVELARLASATTHVSADDPPFHIAHGTADTVVWPVHSALLHAALMDAGVASELRMIEGAGHGLPPAEDQHVRDFFSRVLGNAACPVDVNNDLAVNSGDISVFLGIWLGSLTAGSVGADFDDSGHVNSSDIAAYLGAWIDAVNGGGC